MTTYIISVIFAALMILISALISSAIKYEGGAHPKDPKKRKMWFWTFAILNPLLFFTLSLLLLAPADQAEHDDFMSALPIATAIGFVLYIVLGFIMSKLFKNGKIGNWF
jgi:uncharacterized membrane protein